MITYQISVSFTCLIRVVVAFLAVAAAASFDVCLLDLDVVVVFDGGGGGGGILAVVAVAGLCISLLGFVVVVAILAVAAVAGLDVCFIDVVSVVVAVVVAQR